MTREGSSMNCAVGRGVWVSGRAFEENATLCEDVCLYKGCCIREGAHVAFLRGEPMLLCTLSFGGPVRTGTEGL